MKSIWCLLGFHDWSKWRPHSNAKWDVRFCQRKGCAKLDLKRVVG
jgi:hypothetical protein